MATIKKIRKQQVLIKLRKIIEPTCTVLRKKLCGHYSLELEKAMAPHSSTLAWKIPWMEEPGRLWSMGSLRVGHDWVTSLSLFLSCIGEGNGNPLQCFCLENPRGGGAWWADVYGVAQSRTRLKWLSLAIVLSILIFHCGRWCQTVVQSDHTSFTVPSVWGLCNHPIGLLSTLAPKKKKKKNFNFVT